MAQTDPYSGTATATSGQGDALNRQPTVFDYSQQSQFKVFFALVSYNRMVCSEGKCTWSFFRSGCANNTTA